MKFKINQKNEIDWREMKSINNSKICHANSKYAYDQLTSDNNILQKVKTALIFSFKQLKIFQMFSF